MSELHSNMIEHIMFKDRIITAHTIVKHSENQ